MSTISQGSSTLVRKPAWIEAREMWASLAIVSIWLAVLVTAVFGPDIRSNDAGGNSTTIPSAVVVALFALFATLAVAKKLIESGRIPRDEEIVLCVTGNGLKTQDAVFAAVEEPATIKPALAAFEAVAGIGSKEPALV